MSVDEGFHLLPLMRRCGYTEAIKLLLHTLVGVPVSSIDDLNYVISLIQRCLFIPCQHPIGPIVDPGGRCGAKREAEFKEVLVAN